MRQLPTFYYLTHFHEFLQFVESPCRALLHDEHLAFLDAFHEASKEQQCVLVRCINRKFCAIKLSSLRFDELPNIPNVVQELIALGWLSFPQLEDISNWLMCLTKEELHDAFHACADPDWPRPNKSAPKAKLLAQCQSIPPEQFLHYAGIKDYIVRRVDPIIDYFLFLYFGNLKARLNQFSMRDLGIMSTRDKQAQMQARYPCKNEALSDFLHAVFLSKVRKVTFNSAEDINDMFTQVPVAVGAGAQEKHQSILFELAKQLVRFNREQALTIIGDIESASAQEFWCREVHKTPELGELQARLEHIIDTPLNERILAFAEDFLARKFQKKRTSVLTDMLRVGNQHLDIDEIYKGSVERGVIAHYSHQNKHAFKTENILWRSIFGLIFWQELFELPGLGLATEFDVYPSCLKQNNFYQLASEHIHAKLNQVSDTTAMLRMIRQNAAKYYGKSQGVFHWRSNLLEQLEPFVTLSKVNAIKAQLLRMSKDWSGCNDGFPDIMVIENDKLWFEEIKAQGDVLRRNQLACIQSMRECGFDVRITTVDFVIDPNQAYVVVDIETTGGRAPHHRITEIGMVKWVNGEVLERWQSLINPERRIPSNITALTGIDNDMVSAAPVFSELADDIDAFTEGCIFVAHNVNFDYGFIKAEFARLERFWRRPKLCTVQQMRKYYKGLPSYSLANLTRHFDIHMTQHHRAMSDALAASELLKLINQKRLSADNL